MLQYIMMMMGALAVLAWFGSLIDNLLLTYLIGQFLISIISLSDLFAVGSA